MNYESRLLRCIGCEALVSARAIDNPQLLMHYRPHTGDRRVLCDKSELLGLVETNALAVRCCYALNRAFPELIS